MVAQVSALQKGTPCDTSLSRLFAKIDPDTLGKYFTKWISSLSSITNEKVSSIDGKTMRESYATNNNKANLYIVSAFASEQELCRGGN